MALIREERDPQFWNTIANHPDVRPFIGPGEAEVDLSGIVEFPLNALLATDHGGFAFVKHEPGRYELHTIFGPRGRGQSVLTAFEEAARWMFTRTDCLEIVTKTAATNRPAAWMARLAGFRPIFVRQAASWDGSDVTFYVLTLDEWLQRDTAIEAEGHRFHQLLVDAKREAGSELPIHPDDAAHDRAAGAAALMARLGHAAKGVWIYTRWAKLAGYRDIELLSDGEAPMIDVRDAIITVRNGEIEVVECR